MARAPYVVLDPLFGDGFADEMLRLCERFGAYGMYGEEPIREGLGAGLAQRHDAALNFIRSGGRFARREDPQTLAARTNYFRETYAYDRPVVPGIERFLWHEGFVEAAHKVHGRPIVAPNIVYANLLVPGQELAVHTDVPEFRGVNRTRDPQWLMVAMHHSRLFERWRMPIATGVAYFGGCAGGDLAFYPNGPEAAPETIPVKHDTAVVLDTDSVFHGVDRVAELRAPIPPLRPGMKLRFRGEGRWTVGFGDEVVASYAWPELRFSVSWKAYCYADEAERRTVESHADDLTQQSVVARLVDDLRERGRIPGEVPGPTELALLVIDEYIRFPRPAAGAEPPAPTPRSA
jgi:hypothetical protein